MQVFINNNKPLSVSLGSWVAGSSKNQKKAKHHMTHLFPFILGMPWRGITGLYDDSVLEVLRKFCNFVKWCFITLHSRKKFWGSQCLLILIHTNPCFFDHNEPWRYELLFHSSFDLNFSEGQWCPVGFQCIYEPFA